MKNKHLIWHREEQPYAVQLFRPGTGWFFLGTYEFLYNKNEAEAVYRDAITSLSAGEIIRVVKLSRYSFDPKNPTIVQVERYREGK